MIMRRSHAPRGPQRRFPAMPPPDSGIGCRNLIERREKLLIARAQRRFSHAGTKRRIPDTSAAHNRRRLGVPGAAQGVFRITLAQYPRKAIRTCCWRFPNLPAVAAPDARQRLVSRDLTGSGGSPGDQRSRAPIARSSALRTIARWRRSSAGRRRGEPRVTDWFS
jgi:hypothetical protein